jgi:RNA recognition motif-containing protein
MNKNLYVGNLATEVTEEDLKHNFSQSGTVVSANIIKDNYTGMSRGFGFVEMETEEGAAEAIKRLNGGELCGKVITVNEARPKRDTRGGARPSSPRPGGPRSGGARSGGAGGAGRSGGYGRRY